MKNTKSVYEGQAYIRIPTKWYAEISKLSNKQAGQLCTAIMEKFLQNVEPDIKDKTVEKLFKRMVPTIKRYEHYHKYPQPGRNTSEYRRWRAAVLQRDNFTCQSCGQVGGKLHVHHIKPYSLYPELRCDINNGITLCEKCHKEIHKVMRHEE